MAGIEVGKAESGNWTPLDRGARFGLNGASVAPKTCRFPCTSQDFRAFSLTQPNQGVRLPERYARK